MNNSKKIEMLSKSFSDEDMKILETGIREWRDELETKWSNCDYVIRSEKELEAEWDKYDRILKKLEAQG